MAAMAVGSRPLVPSRLAPGGWPSARARPRARPRTVLGGYIALTKPRIIELLLITTVPTMVLAAAAAGRRLALVARHAASAARWPPAAPTPSTWYVDRDIDRLMPRTQGRPLVTGLITPRHALVFAIGLEVAAFAVLWCRRQPALGRAGARGHPVLRLRLHAVAEAHEHPEHRHRRRRRRGAGARRLGGGAPARSPGRRSCCSS